MITIAKKDESDSIDDIGRLKQRFQSAVGQEQSVLGEVFEHLKRTVKKQDSLEQRVRVLESKITA